MTEEPNDPYLWDRSGEPDALVEALERKLAPLSLAASGPAAERAPAPRPARVAPRWILAAAAAALLALPFLWLAPGPSKPKAPLEPGYEVVLREGKARVVDGRMKISEETELAPDKPQRFPVGLTLSCDLGSSVVVKLGEHAKGDLGEVTIEGPGSVVLEESTPELRKLFLHEGRLRARVAANAKERLFQVGTPAGKAVDLGCVYTMKVDSKSGSTELRVQLGRVAFELGARTLFVWAGASCVVDGGSRASLPIDDAALPEFRQAAESWDRAADDAARKTALAEMRRFARADDAPTIWHALAASQASTRAEAIGCLEAVSPCGDVSQRAAALRGDAEALERWRVEIMGW